MSREYIISCIVPNTKAGEQLITACQNLVKRANEELTLSAATISFKLDGIYGDPFPNQEPKSIEDRCDIGIAYGDSLSVWVNDNIFGKPFLLMSAAEIKGIQQIHLKAYPSAATMGWHLAELTQRCITDRNNENVYALFEASEAGSLCSESFKKRIEDFALRKVKIEEYEPGNSNFYDYVKSLIAERFCVFCVYGFETSGPGYKSLLNSLIQCRENGADIKILTDVNRPDDLLKDTELNDALVCGSSENSKQYCVGVNFFGMLMEALVELIIKSVMWSPRGGNDVCLKDEIIKNYNYISTKIGTFSFVDNALCVPFYYYQNAALDNPETFRPDSYSRDSIAIATARMEQLADDIFQKAPKGFEVTCVNAKDRFKNEILSACFSVAQMWFVDDFEFIDDKWPLKKSFAAIRGNSIIQIPYKERGFSDSNVLQLYWQDASGNEQRKVFSIDEISKVRQIGKFKIVVAKNNVNSDEHAYKVLSVDESLRLVENFSVLGLDTIQKGGYLYYIPYARTSTGGAIQNVSGVVLVASIKYRDVELTALKNLVERFFGAIYAVDNQIKINRESVKSAIGSIMSRNGSHNIGSHVLAALSHNVGTMPDDRVLYQYIQHRMDYIATATTEFPIWKQPTKIVGDVFKTFLSQYHLLNYISGSEGLKAYQFQNPNIDLSTAEQGGTIRVHIRRIDDDDDGWTQSNLFVPGTTGKQPVDFIVYPAGKEMRLDKDVEIAIPGGVIGQHAIYTIIENILRNAAKHEWSNLDKEGKEKCHLDLFVDFKDRPVDGVVEFVVWTCNEKSPTERANGIESDISVSDIYEKLVNEDKGAKLDLAGLLPHQQLQVKVSRPFISSNGQLHKENWGLAEMRISAGFLNTVDIGEIGGVNCTGANGWQYVEKCLRLIKPVMVQGEIPREQHEKGQKKTTKSSRKVKPVRKKCYALGYNFVIPKPKELLVIIPDEIVEVHKEGVPCNVRKTLSQADIEAVHKKLRRFGVGVITESELKSPDADITYSYVLAKEIAGELQELTNGEKGWVCHEEFLKLPFRVLSARGNRPSNQKGTWVGEYTGNLYGSNEGLAKTLMAILSDDFNVEVFAQKLKIEVCRDWLRHIKMQRGFSFSDIPIVIDLYGDSGNSGQSLVTDSDLLKIVFQNCFNAAVKSFFEMWLAEECVEPINGDEVVRKYIQDAKCVRTVLAILLVMCPRQLEESTGCSKPQARTRELIQNQLGGWCREARNKIEDGTLANWVSSYYSQRSGDEKDKMPAMLRKVLDELDNAEDATATRNATNCLKVAEQWFAGDDQSINDIPFLGDFIKYLEKTILEQARVFLSKYEERHVTLPCCFAASEYKKEQDTSLYAFSGQEKRKDAQEIEFTSDEDEKIKKGRNAIAYWRHETFKVERSAPPFYLEPLSGAQSYFNSFVQLANEFKNYGDASNARFGHSIVKLVETGLFRVLLIDERVTKFISEHANVAKTFEHIGVNAIDDNSSATKKLFDRIEPSKIVIDSRGATISDFDILIIHQGIIDKLLLGHEDPDNVKEFIRHIVEEVRYVIITTGRGSPANIPSTARVLPFSVIENTLFKNYPEKMILVDAVMNVLPDSNTKKG